MTHLVAPLLALGLIAGACGSGDSGSETGGSDEPGAADDATAEDADGGGATWTGVTDDTVTLGVLTIDFEGLKELVDVDMEGGPVKESWEAWAAAQNERGGVAGRDVEVIVSQFIPVGPEFATEACVRLLEDNDVFLVEGQLLDDQPLCVTEAHETPYIGMFGLTAERGERSVAPFLAVETAMDLQREWSAEILVEEELLEGRRVGVHWDATDQHLADIVLPILEGGDVNIVETSVAEDFGTDIQARAEAMDLNIERLRNADAEVVINISNVLGLIPALERNDFVPELIMFNGQASDGGQYDDVDARFLEGAMAITVNKPTVGELAEDELFLECIDEFNASDPAEPLVLEEMALSVVRQIQTTCAGFRMFVLLAEEAGADLTPDTLLAAAEGYGPIVLPGVLAGSLGPGKLSAQDTMRVYEFDPVVGEMVPASEPMAMG